jgi:two-component system sensor histidine kinase/response regulator
MAAVSSPVRFRRSGPPSFFVNIRSTAFDTMAQNSQARILVVDDESTQMRALCEALKNNGYEPVGCSSAKAALEAMDGARFDLLLTDLMMPEMDGIALLQMAARKDSDIVGIIMSGEGTITTAVEAMKSGALDYILKPFKLKAILPVLARALELRRLRVENAILGKRVLDRTEKLESANKELESFAYSISHDLRAPLRHIEGYADLLIESVGATLSEEDRGYFNSIVKSVGKMNRLIDDLLHFSRTSRAEMHRGRVNLQDLLESVMEDIKPETEGRAIVWKKGPLPVVQGDPSLLRQVFINLLHNALKYSRPRNPAEIEIGSRVENEETVIFIKDNGVGFNMEYADKLFGVFQRLHSPQKFEGTGVGLANVRRIIARHGGRTWAEGKVDEGATFYFSLPS